MGTPPPKEGDALREEVAGPSAPSSSMTPVGETSRGESTKVPQDPPKGKIPPKDPFEDFTGRPTGTPYGEGSYTPSGSFPWVSDVGPMLDEIWSKESFKRLSEAPL